MREGLNDCRMAAVLDPNFMVNLRSAKYKIEKGVKLEPIEEVNEEHVGMVMEPLSHRRAEVTDMGPVAGNFGVTRMTLTCPSRGLVGYRSVFSSDTRGTRFMHRAFMAYEKYCGPLGNVRKGVLDWNFTIPLGTSKQPPTPFCYLDFCMFIIQPNVFSSCCRSVEGQFGFLFIGFYHIENEYGCIEDSFGQKGKDSVKWAAEMSVGLGASVPRARWKENDALEYIHQQTYKHMTRMNKSLDEKLNIVSDVSFSPVDSHEQKSTDIITMTDKDHLPSSLILDEDQLSPPGRVETPVMEETSVDLPAVPSYVELTEKQQTDARKMTIKRIIDSYKQLRRVKLVQTHDIAFLTGCSGEGRLLF
ncbi:unnamed protein product [Lactuca saligna]|uniref:Elongation factor EFG domain-containing protein n=1 Tax=Lactuca saligna TaxID=75948 RepID=A0AA35YHL9_LACSI|nr:unnamed protein product [Lactuca saligna]